MFQRQIAYTRGYIMLVHYCHTYSNHCCRRKAISITYSECVFGPVCLFVCLFVQLRTAAFKAYCAILVRRSNFHYQASPRESTLGRKVELWARNVREFCLNSDLHFTFRDLLHAVELRHGTDGFTSPPKEGVLRIFFRPKNTTASEGVRNRELGYF